MSDDPSQQTTAAPWEACHVGSCHRHRACMYAPCRRHDARAEPNSLLPAFAEGKLPPRNDSGAWLSEFHALSWNVLGLVSRGQSETAAREINAAWKRWRDATDV